MRISFRKSVEKAKPWLIACVLFLTVLVGLIRLQPGLAQSPSPTPQGATSDPNHVLVQITFLGFDPIRGELDTRLGIFPKGTFGNKDTGFPSADLKLTDIYSVTKHEFEFKKDKRLEVPITKYAILDGDVGLYPFDKHTTKLGIYIEKLPETPGATPAPATPATPPSPAPASPASPNTKELITEDVPLEYDFFDVLPGYKITEKADDKDDKETAEFISQNITITRSIPTIAVSLGVILIMWVTAIIAMLMTIKMARSGRMPDPWSYGLMVALSFAFPAIRNAQPNIPPAGVLSDYLAFFWTEPIAVICFIVVGICWLKRYDRPETKS